MQTPSFSDRRHVLRLMGAMAAAGLPGAGRSAAPAGDEAAGASAKAAVAEVAPQRLAITTPRGKGELALATSADLQAGQSGLTRAVVMVHGRLRDAMVYHATLMQAAQAAGEASRGALLVSPQFLAESDVRRHQLAPSTLRWPSNGWSDGGDAAAPGPIGSYEALDALVRVLADRSRFPDLAEIVVAGHSGGGQVVQRYALLGEDAPAGVRLRYVVANPSSYAWFGTERPRPAVAAACPGFDTWKYGLGGLPRAAHGLDAATLERRYVSRDVTLLLGTADTDPDHPALDKRCEAEAQGAFRLERGEAFHATLQQRHPGVTHTLWKVAGVAHDGRAMYTSREGLQALFGTSR